MTDNSTSGILGTPQAEVSTAHFEQMTTLSSTYATAITKAKRNGRWWVLKSLGHANMGQRVYEEMLLKEFDILPKVSCSINFRDFLVRQLSQLSRSFPLKDGQSIPLADLFFAAQEFQLGRHSKTQPDQLARLYINATASIEAVSAYRFFENHIGTQFLALHGDKNKVMEMFSSPLKARFVQNRIETLLSDTLMRRFGSYFRECLCDSPAIRLTLRLKNIDVAEDVLIWQFEPVLPDSAADRQSPAAEALPEAEAGKTPLRGTAEESRPEAQENEPLPEAQSRGSRPKATE